MNAVSRAAAQAIVGSAMTVGAMDAVWLTFRNTYHQALFSNIQKSPLAVRWVPALLIYVLIPVAIFLAAVKPAKDIQDAAIRGAVTGFILYAFYDLTNYATLTQYTLEMTLTDISWGTCVGAIGGLSGYFFYTR